MFQHLRASGEVTACANASDQRVKTFRKVGQDFLRCGPHMHRDVGGVFKLLRHPRAGRGGHQFLRAGDGPFHAVGSGGQYEFSPKGFEHRPPFFRHRLGHRQNEAIAAGGTGERQGNPGISAGRLDDFNARLEHTAALGIPTVLLHIAYGPLTGRHRFGWLFDAPGYSLGDVIPDLAGGSTDRSLETILEGYRASAAEWSDRTHTYCLSSHGIERWAGPFLEAVDGTHFRWSDLPPALYQPGVFRRTYQLMRHARRKAG